MTAAWEMYLQKQYFVLSINFTPYHHKPPMLFWLINLAWEVFGVSRWAALVPVFVGTSALMLLTQKLCEMLFPEKEAVIKITPWLLLGSVPFLIYGTLVMFDTLVAALSLAFLYTMLRYAQKPSLSVLAIAGLLLGAGVLTKGPVMYLYTLWPTVLYFWWRPENALQSGKFYKALGLSLLISLIPILAWLIPVLTSTSDNFAFWLVWNQTAGRITGNFSSAHVHPFYFYLPLLPVLFLPWIFFPGFWRNIKTASLQNPAFRFLLSATLPVFLSFSLIAGKQPHYLLPLLPFIVIFIATLVSEAHPRILKAVSLVMVFLLILGQGIASQIVFPRYDLMPYAAFYQEHKDADWAFAPNYQGEMGFMARAEHPFDNIQKKHLSRWFVEHPGGYALVRYDTPDEIKAFKEIYSAPYKGKWIGIYTGTDG
ncbi:MAG: glycosyltransferase family 39 protein [Alphaproteobacteria bacterium]|nr:glycosyltransferase family 39 protein [Alphaproteobacteria bacterium]